MTNQRLLTDAESKVVALLRLFDRLASHKKLTVKLKLTNSALADLKLNNIAKPLKIIDLPEQRASEVMFTLTEYKKYVDYYCNKVGFTVKIDGSVRTFDGLTLSHEEDH